MSTRTIKVDYLARVEGEGALYIKVKDRQVVDVQLKIFEPPRFFEAMLRGRQYTEAPDITARICGICPVAYQMSACHAMEAALGIEVPESIAQLRRLLYCGEWIESHGLHVFMLHAPDFLGYEDGIAMSRDHPDLVKRGLRLKKLGNEIMRIVGGREIHPINVRVGGFYRAPTAEELGSLRDELLWARDAAAESVAWAAGLDFPPFERDYVFVSLQHPDEYPMNRGRVVSSAGLDIAPSEYEDHFEEQHLEHTNALHSTLKDVGSYLVGPLARFNLNGGLLSPAAREAAASAGLVAPVKNPFQGIVVRCVEMLHASEEALRIIESYEPPEHPYVAAPTAHAVGYGITEAPRGLLYHRYELEGDGSILDAKIVPPTSQNQKSIEDDLWQFVPERLDLPKQALSLQSEQLVRSYDPCISCATHFLKMHVEEA